MDAGWLDLIKQAPFLCAFIWLVVVFLKHIKENDAENRKVIENNTEMATSVREMMGRCAHALDQHEIWNRNNGRP